MSQNTWVHLIVRPVVRPLAQTSVTPNHITVLRLATAVASATMLATSDRHWHVIAGFVFLVSFFLDRADGELARQSSKSTPWGARFDLISDNLSNALTFLGLGIGLRGSGLGAATIALGLIAGCAIVGIFWLIDRIDQAEGAGSGIAAFAGSGGFDPDDILIIVPFAIWLDGEMPLLLAAAIGAPAYLLWSGWHFRRYLTQP
jgi:archaetidylinositol phosphate synthase